MSDDLETLREEAKCDGRSLIEVAATMLAFGAVVGAVGPVFVLAPFAPDIPLAQATIIGMGSGLLAGIALVIVYRLVEDRLVAMYLGASDVEATGGETA